MTAIAQAPSDTLPDYGLPGIPLPLIKPGSQAWIDAGMSSSKVSAVLGYSTYDSYFSIWHTLAGNLEYDSTPNEIQHRGHLLEPAVATWFCEQHPDWNVCTTGSWRHPEIDRFFTTPDRIAIDPDGHVYIVEIKTAATDDEWGKKGTNEVPRGYYAQCQWHLYVTGADECRVAVLKSRLEFAEYVIGRDEEFIADMVAQVCAFLDTLPGGPNYALPDLDGHTATYSAVRKMHPDIVEGKVEIPAEIVAEFIEARRLADFFDNAKRHWTAEIADRLGPFKTATVGGRVIAYRKSMGSRGRPFVQAVDKLPTAEELAVLAPSTSNESE